MFKRDSETFRDSHYAEGFEASIEVYVVSIMCNFLTEEKSLENLRHDAVMSHFESLGPPKEFL